MRQIIGNTWKVLYTNWRGEKAIRHITISDIMLGSTEYHKHEQVLMKVYDHDRNDDRIYAMCDVEKWEPVKKKFDISDTQ